MPCYFSQSEIDQRRDERNAASAMLFALKAIQRSTASPATGFGKKDAMMRACQIAEREARAAIAQAEAVGIKPLPILPK